jgi:N-acetylglucosaminyl-diphospho-decaprenol L-rhamnosyltransferase
MSLPTFSFVIVTYNSADTIELCLASIAGHTAQSYEVAVVDNSPTDETAGAVRRFAAAHPEVQLHLIRPEENVGFGRGCNLGARHSSGKYLFFLNPDTQLMNDAAASLVQCLSERPGALAAGPAIFDSEGTVTRTCRRLPNLGHVVLDATGLDRWFGAYKLTRFAHDQAKQIDQVIGAAMVMRRRDYERLGGMDEQFFIYFEEVDLCKRIQQAGGEIWFWPDAQVQHLAGHSCETDSVRARMIFVLRESRKKYFTKHYGVLGGLALEAVNRMEAIEKVTVLMALWMLQRKRKHREKAQGFWAVATGVAPQV